MLDALLTVHHGTFRLDLPLRIEAAEVVALLGPNGAGKTTALRALAGLQDLTAGHVRLDGADLTTVPPEGRPIGMVFQDYLLFPHLSALDNVAFGPRCRGMSKPEAAATARDWLHRVGLSGLEKRKPRQLSGGQAQRVALARALAVRPSLLLLDEPLAALDTRTRMQTRAALRHHLGLHDGATLVVTHDPLDALVLADRLVILEAGRVVQSGTPAEVTSRPDSRSSAAIWTPEEPAPTTRTAPSGS